MYIPAVINLLQVSLSSFSSQFLDFGTHDDVWANNLNRLATLSPYHDRTKPPGVRADLPADCAVDQVILLHRHGSRGPAGEQGYIDELVETLGNASIPHHLPPNLRFLKDGYKSDLVPEALTVIGRQQLFDHGVQFALQYPTFSTNTFLATDVERVIESAHYFGRGLLGHGVEVVTVNELGLPVNWLRPWDACPKYNPVDVLAHVAEWQNTYIPPITHRLNVRLPGVGLSDNDTRGALLACPYDLAAHDKSPWCGAFYPHELRGLEYEYDLMMDGLTGYISRNDTGPIIGSVYVNKLIERLTNATGDAQELYLEFAHDTTVLYALSAMSLNKDKVPLPSDHILFPRKFQTSQQAPFAARMIWERFSCKKSFDGPQVRLLLNGETFPLSICQKSLKDKKYGTCSVSEFVEANTFSTNIHYGDETWNAACVKDDSSDVPTMHVDSFS
ncbi:hypothetical protein ID866_5791 [Astraeus odoratus]|nr:hypothetical protein ID866_5791 [Astraeus odoratus]